MKQLGNKENIGQGALIKSININLKKFKKKKDIGSINKSFVIDQKNFQKEVL